MSVSIKLLLADYERARALGDFSRANSIFKQMEKIGLPDYLKSKPKSARVKTNAKPLKDKQTQVKLDPGRF